MLVRRENQPLLPHGPHRVKLYLWGPLFPANHGLREDQYWQPTDVFDKPAQHRFGVISPSVAGLDHRSGHPV